MVRSLQASRSSLDKSPAGSYAGLDKPHQGSRQRGLSHSPYGWKNHHQHQNKCLISTPSTGSGETKGSNLDESENVNVDNPVPMIESPMTPHQSQSLPPLYLEDGFQGSNYGRDISSKREHEIRTFSVIKNIF